MNVSVAAPVVDPNLPPARRLGPATIPLAYDLTLELDPSEASFVGEVTIDIDVREPLHTVWLHEKDLQISHASVEQERRTIELDIVEAPESTELLGLRADSELAKGRAQLHLRWRGKLGTTQGVFRQSEGGQWYIYSDFEATDARSAFPCYDDPRFKTPWTVSLVVPSGQLALSNYPEERRTEATGERTEFHFETTRPLPSYLVAMAAGPFDVLEGRASNTPLRVIAPRNEAQGGRIVLESTGTMLEFLEEYLGMAMPFPKLDFIAVPHFGGAMENPGLVTFSSGILLVGDTPTASERRRALGVTAHELAHLWFGDLITPDYWNDLWLNEAFATWLSIKAVAAVQPERADDVLDIADKTAAYPIDYGIDGRRVREPIKDLEDIRRAFDHITYRKGGAILTMLEGWLGEAQMRAAVRHYLRAGDGGTVVAETLIASVAESAGRRDTTELFKTFLNQTGIPQIHASVACDGAPTLALRQSRYLPLETRPKQTAGDRRRRWHVPVCVRYPSGNASVPTQRQCIELGSESIELPLETKTCPEWLLPNDGDTGYYHYIVSPAIYASLPVGELSPREQRGLAHSISAAIHAGELDLEHGLPLFEPLLEIESSQVHDVIFDLLDTLAKSVIGDVERPAFAAWIRTRYRPLAKRVGLAPSIGEAQWIEEVRPGLLLVLADLGEDDQLRKSLRERVEAWLDEPDEIDLLVLDAWLQGAALGGDENLAKRYRNALRRSRNGLHRLLLSGAIHAFREFEHFSDILAMEVRSPAVWPVLAKSMRDPQLRRHLFEELEPGDLQFEEAQIVFASLCDATGMNDVKAFATSPEEVQALTSPIASCLAFAKEQRASAQTYFAPGRPEE